MYERASRSVTAFTPPKTFIRSHAQLRTRKVVLSGGAFVAASVLGIVTLGAANVAAKAGGNTGNGTFVLDGVAPLPPSRRFGMSGLHKDRRPVI